MECEKVINKRQLSPTHTTRNLLSTDIVSDLMYVFGFRHFGTLTLKPAMLIGNK